MRFPLIDDVLRKQPEQVHKVFPDCSADEIGDQLTAFAQSHGQVQAIESFAVSIGAVATLRLQDGHRVVVKALAASRADEAHLRACREIMSQAVSVGIPAPQPLSDLERIDDALFVLDSYLIHTGPSTPTRAIDRQELALMLRRINTLGASGFPEGLWSTTGLREDDHIWGPPHDVIFDFAKYAEGSAWIDEIGRHAQAVMRAAQHDHRRVVAHTDFSAENVRRRANGAVVAVFDWDSVLAMPETIHVGQASITYKYRHDTEDNVPTVDEQQDFVRAYELARGEPFSSDERRVIDAAAVYAVGYSARCENSGPWRTQPGGRRAILPDLVRTLLR